MGPIFNRGHYHLSHVRKRSRKFSHGAQPWGKVSHELQLMASRPQSLSAGRWEFLIWCCPCLSLTCYLTWEPHSRGRCSAQRGLCVGSSRWLTQWRFSSDFWRMFGGPSLMMPSLPSLSSWSLLFFYFACHMLNTLTYSKLKIGLSSIMFKTAQNTIPHL